jgi:hypothetical protein
MARPDFGFRSLTALAPPHEYSCGGILFFCSIPLVAVAKRQTRQLEGLVGATPWRFKSSPRHQPKTALKTLRTAFLQCGFSVCDFKILKSYRVIPKVETDLCLPATFEIASGSTRRMP